jgi:hypothetical protein
MTKKNILEIFIAFIIVAGAMYSAVAYFASAKDLNLVDMRLEQKIVGDGILGLTMQMGQLEAKHGSRDCSTWSDIGDREQYQRLEVQIEALKKKQDAIIQEQTKKQ